MGSHQLVRPVITAMCFEHRKRKSVRLTSVFGEHLLECKLLQIYQDQPPFIGINTAQAFNLWPFRLRGSST